MSLVLGLLVLLISPSFGEGPRVAEGPTEPGPAAPVIEAFAADKALADLDLGVHVRCTADRAVWGAKSGSKRLNPASGAKLLSTAAALSVFPVDQRFATRVHARLEGGSARDFTLVAEADPSLTVDDLQRLAGALHKAGVRQVEGPISVDLGYFAGPTTPPAFDTKNSDAGYRPEVPSFAVASGTFTATVSPAKKVGEAVRVTTGLLAPSLVVDNSATTVAGDAIDKLVIAARGGADGKTRLVVSGTLGLKAPPQGVKKRLADPARIAAELFVRALAKKGIEAKGELRFVTAAKAELPPELARIDSDPLVQDIRDLNTNSNNFMAETVFKHLGAEGEPPLAGPASWERAVTRTRAALLALGLPEAGFEIINGSGLYDGTKVSAEAMTLLLSIETADTPGARGFRDSLAVAGKSGTLKKRLGKLAGKVSGKTGTLDNALSLSGYVPSSRCLLAFSVLVNGDIGERAPAVSKSIDALVLGLAAL